MLYRLAAKRTWYLRRYNEVLGIRCCQFATERSMTMLKMSDFPVHDAGMEKMNWFYLLMLFLLLALGLISATRLMCRQPYGSDGCRSKYRKPKRTEPMMIRMRETLFGPRVRWRYNSGPGSLDRLQIPAYGCCRYGKYYRQRSAYGMCSVRTIASAT